MWTGVIVFAAVALYIVQKRVSYFVPGSLKPGNVLALLRQGVGAGRAVPRVQPPPSASPDLHPGLDVAPGGGNMPPSGRQAQQVAPDDQAFLSEAPHESQQGPGGPTAPPAIGREGDIRTDRNRPMPFSDPPLRQESAWQDHVEL